jgi:hypothetical protein
LATSHDRPSCGIPSRRVTRVDNTAMSPSASASTLGGGESASRAAGPPSRQEAQPRARAAVQTRRHERNDRRGARSEE